MKTIMNICIVSPWTLPSVGGTQKLVHGIAAGLCSHDKFNVTVITAEYDSKMIGVVDDVEMTSFPYEVVRLPLKACPPNFTTNCGFQVEESWILENVPATISRICPHVVLYTPHACAFGIQALHGARLCSATFVLWPAIHLDRWDHTCTDAIQFYRLADIIVANSLREANWLKNRVGLKAERVQLLGCGYSAQCIEVAQLRSTRVENGKPLKLLSVGQLREHKHFCDQVEAVNILVHELGIEATLTIAGARFEAFDELKTRIQRLNLEGRVCLLLNCTEKELRGNYLSSDFFLFTSSSESFGLAVLEAIACGVFPIVYPGHVYSDMVIESGFGVVVEAKTPHALAKGIAETSRKSYASVNSVQLSSVEWLGNRSSHAIATRLGSILLK